MSSDRQILFVDDDEEDRLIMLQYFREFGKQQNVEFRSNGREAIDFLEQIADDGLLPCLIVLDLNMPILNGTQTLLHIKRIKRLSRIPVIILSTSENDNERRKCLSLGAEDYLVKPSTYQQGLKLIEKFSAYIR
jgi:CheY-like chemotaxis protein